jgi:hypothetical protein
MPAKETEKTRYLLPIVGGDGSRLAKNLYQEHSPSRLHAEKLLNYGWSSVARENPQIYDTSQFQI